LSDTEDQRLQRGQAVLRGTENERPVDARGHLEAVYGDDCDNDDDDDDGIDSDDDDGRFDWQLLCQ